MSTSSNDLNSIWNSPANTPPSGLLEKHRQHLQQRLRKRYRTFWGITGMSALWMCLLLVKLAIHVRQGGTLQFQKEWGALVAFGLPVVALTLFWMQQWRHYRRHPSPGASILEGIHASLDELRISRKRLRILAGMHVFLMLLMPLMVAQLRGAGKAGDEILLPFLVLLPALLGLILLAFWYHDRHTLQPRQTELEKLLTVEA